MFGQVRVDPLPSDLVATDLVQVGHYQYDLVGMIWFPSFGPPPSSGVCIGHVIQIV